MNDQLAQKLNNYTVPSVAVELIKQTKVVFLVGVAGAGKDTIIHHLLQSSNYHYIVSHTTRPPRYNHDVLEQDGREYHFIDLARAEEMLDNGEFIEAKLVHGNIYGTSVAEIQAVKDKAEIAISEIEVQGIAEYRAVADTVLPIFLLPPDFHTWQQRLAKRYGESQDADDFQARMQTAKDELKDALDKPYFEFVINNDLDTTVKIVDGIAHGNLSREKNDQAKVIARDLLEKLDSTL